MIGMPFSFCDGERRQTGVAALEFALILPVLLLIVFGIIDFGVALYNKAVITNASREGARAGIVLRAPILPDATIQAIVDNRTSTLLQFSGTSDVVTTVVHGHDESNGGRDNLTVHVSYEYKGLLLGPMVSLLTPLTGPIAITASTTMDYE